MYHVKTKPAMKTVRTILSLVLLLQVGASVLHAAPFTFAAFMQMAGDSCAAYLAEQYNVSIAVANAQAARIFNNPEIGFTYSNNQDWNLQMGQSYEVEMSYAIPLGGERQARIRVAKDEEEIARQAVADYLRQMRTSAADAWSEAWLAAKRSQLMHRAYKYMLQVAQSDSLRLETGDINRTDALQSAVTARTYYNDWMLAQADSISAMAALALYVGGHTIASIADTLSMPLMPAGTLEQLCQLAYENRADLRVAELTKQLTKDQLRLVRASYAPELTLSAGYVHNTVVLNEEAPAPRHNGFSVGFSMPIPFAAANKGERNAAQFAVQQSEKAYEAACQELKLQVTRAYYSYRAALSVWQGYDSGILSDVQQILNSRTDGYRLGETDLLELIAAQDSYNQVLTDYYEAIASAFSAHSALLATIGL